MLNTDYGFDVQNLHTVELQDVEYNTFRSHVTSKHYVQSVTGMQSPPVIGGRDQVVLQSERGDKYTMRKFEVEYGFLETLNTPLVAGSAFPEGSSGAHSVVLNETAVAQLGYRSADEAVGRSVVLKDTLHQVSGVVSDFRVSDISESIAPVVIEQRSVNTRTALVRVQAGEKNIDRLLKSTWSTLGSEYSLRSQEFEKGIQTLYAPFIDLLKVIGAGAGCAILLSFIGLFGITFLTTRGRKREVAIRKSVGASRFSLIWLLSKEFAVSIFVSQLIAIPAAYYINNAWLSNYSVRVDSVMGLLVVGSVFLMLLAIASTVIQVGRVADVNPAETLRNA